MSLIKEGKPITPVKGEPDGFFTSQLDGSVTHSSPQQQNQQLQQQANGESKISPAKAPAPVAADRPGTNGSAAPPGVKKGVVEVCVYYASACIRHVTLLLSLSLFYTAKCIYTVFKRISFSLGAPI